MKHRRTAHQPKPLLPGAITRRRSREWDAALLLNLQHPRHDVCRSTHVEPRPPLPGLLLCTKHARWKARAVSSRLQIRWRLGESHEPLRLILVVLRQNNAQRAEVQLYNHRRRPLASPARATQGATVG